MTGDFMHQPLGQVQDAPKARPRRGLVWGTGVALVACAAALSVGWWATRHAPDPAVGTVAVIAPVRPTPAPPPPPPAATTPAPTVDPDSTGDIRVVRPLGAAFPMGKFIPVPQDLAPSPCSKADSRNRAGSVPCSSAPAGHPAATHDP